MLDLVACATHPAMHDLRRILCAHIEPLLQRLARRRKYEHRHHIVFSIGAQLLGALPVYVEQHVATLGQGVFHRFPRRAVVIVEHHRPFQKLVVITHLGESLVVDEVVVLPLYLPFPLLARRIGDRHRKPALLFE
jgi:hypothetical protein